MKYVISLNSGSVKYTFLEFPTFLEAVDYAFECNYCWVDENGFCWEMTIEAEDGECAEVGEEFIAEESYSMAWEWHDTCDQECEEF